MSDRFVYCYLRNWSMSRAGAFIDDLSSVGLKIANPISGRVTALSADEWDAGRQIETTLPRLVAWMALDDRQEQNFQFWVDGSRDVVCRIARLGPIVVQDFYLDGLENSVAREVVSSVAEVLERDLLGLVGLVADLHGDSVDSHWEAVMQGHPGSVTALPDLVIADASVARDLSSRFGLGRSDWHAYGGLSSFDPTGILTSRM